MTDPEKRTLNLPKNTNKAFFAYGIFKPGQIAYSKIRNHVAENIENIEINYQMRHRDGVPILLNEENSQYKTKGSIIKFKPDHHDQAYDLICKTMLKKLYKWEVIEINGEKVNILFGVNPEYGSDYIEDPNERVSFDGKNDPLFKEVLDLIEKNLKSNSSMNPENFFQLQMNYMMLWSAIDRYSSLKYNQKELKKNRSKFSKEKAFKEGIKKFKDEPHRPVYSTDDLRIHKFNEDNAYESINYYYTLRCNVVHRGKAMHNDYYMLRKATEELLEIFRDVLKNAFKK